METKNTNTNYIETRDISLASYLFASQKIKLVGRRKDAKGVVTFHFSPKDKADSLISEYWNLQAPPIQPRELFDALRSLKDIIYSNP